MKRRYSMRNKFQMIGIEAEATPDGMEFLKKFRKYDHRFKNITIKDIIQALPNHAKLRTIFNLTYSNSRKLNNTPHNNPGNPMELILKAESKPLPCGCSPKGTGQPNDPITVNLCQIHKQTQHIIKTLTNVASELAKEKNRHDIVNEISETLNNLEMEHSYSPKFIIKIRSETGIYNIIAYGTQRNDGKWIFKDTNSKTHRFNSVDEVLSFFTGTQNKQDIYISKITNEDKKDIQTLYSINDISLIEPINIDTLSYEN